MRLVGEGDLALTELMQLNPRADRGHLRTLVKNVHRANSNRKEKAELRSPKRCAACSAAEPEGARLARP